MQHTSNYNLNKPDVTDYAKIQALNENADIIDAKLTEISGLQTEFTTHLDESMPHRFVDNGKKYRWGFRTVNGEPEFIYEEVQ